MAVKYNKQTANRAQHVMQKRIYSITFFKFYVIFFILFQMNKSKEHVEMKNKIE